MWLPAHLGIEEVLFGNLVDRFVMVFGDSVPNRGHTGGRDAVRSVPAGFQTLQQTAVLLLADGRQAFALDRPSLCVIVLLIDIVFCRIPHNFDPSDQEEYKHDCRGESADVAQCFDAVRAVAADSDQTQNTCDAASEDFEDNRRFGILGCHALRAQAGHRIGVGIRGGDKGDDEEQWNGELTERLMPEDGEYTGFGSVCDDSVVYADAVLIKIDRTAGENTDSFATLGDQAGLIGAANLI